MFILEYKYNNGSLNRHSFLEIEDLKKEFKKISGKSSYHSVNAWVSLDKYESNIDFKEKFEELYKLLISTNVKNAINIS